MISPTSLLWVISMISIPMAIKKATNPIIFFIYGKLLHLIISLYAASPQIFQVIRKCLQITATSLWQFLLYFRAFA